MTRQPPGEAPRATRAMTGNGLYVSYALQALAVTTLAFRSLLRRVPSLTDRVLEALAARTAR
jgi:hypothetical protein